MRGFLLSLGLLASGAAAAHANGSSDLAILADGNGDGVHVTWDTAVADLQLPLDLDADGDGDLTAGEIDARRAAIQEFAAARIAVQRGRETCPLSRAALTRTQRASEDPLRLGFAGRCPREGPLEVSTSLFFGSPGCSALLDVATPGGRFTSMLSMERPGWSEPPAISKARTALRFLEEGFHAVRIGYDHVAFLLLLLPGVLSRTERGWTAAASGRAVVLDLLKIVTAFTVAHSLTLGLAASGVVRPPVQPIEAAIAGSIVIAGLLNLSPAASRFRLPLAFGFGLIHGFGFANALREIGAAGSRLLPMLAGFNLGVELAQIAIVAAALPVLWYMSRQGAYAHRIMPALSLATAATGAVWFAGRL